MPLRPTKNNSQDNQSPGLIVAQGLHHHRRALTLALEGLSPGQATAYGYLLVNRALIFHALQQGGFCPGGDPWYLQTLLGQCQAQSRDRFYGEVLLPLWLQGLGCPPSERPPALAAQLGSLPYLGSPLFTPQPWEAPPQVHIPDDPWEELLAWLGEHPWVPHQPPSPDVLTLEGLAVALDCWLDWPPSGSAGESVGHHGGDHRAGVEQALTAALQAALAPYGCPPWHTLGELVSVLTEDLCQTLITQVLPTLTVLDPACGAGNCLGAVLKALWPLYWSCWHQGQNSRHAPLRHWAMGIATQGPTPTWALTADLISRHLYGVDDRPGAIASAQTHLLLTLLATTTPTQGVAPVPALGLNWLAGNALMGVVRVEDSRFIPGSGAMPLGVDDLPIQGTLLPALAAKSYHDLLQERAICLETYDRQTQGLQEAMAPIPNPTPNQGEALLGERLRQLNAAAQTKLNQLVLNELSQTLGIRRRYPQGTSPRRRLLTPGDIAEVDPCHWGFHFHGILNQQGGFALILSQGLQGSLRPDPCQFYHHQEPLFHTLGIQRQDWLRQRSPLLKRHPALKVAWANYASLLTLVGDYCRRSPAYGPWPSPRRALPLAALYAQRSQSLLRSGGQLWLGASQQGGAS